MAMCKRFQTCLCFRRSKLNMWDTFHWKIAHCAMEAWCMSMEHEFQLFRWTLFFFFPPSHQDCRRPHSSSKSLLPDPEAQDKITTAIVCPALLHCLCAVQWSIVFMLPYKGLHLLPPPLQWSNNVCCRDAEWMALAPNALKMCASVALNISRLKTHRP